MRSQGMPANHILVVEDDEVLLRGMRDLLELEGYEVSVAVDGLDGMQVLSDLSHNPDLIISDIRMPKMDGYEFLSSVRARSEWLSIPFIFLTAKGQKEDIRYGRLRGVDDYITKPFDFRDLLVSIQASLRRRDELAQWQELRMEALKQRILTVLHHEFRTPLSYIVAYADLLSNSPGFDQHDDLRQYVKGIQDGSDRLSNLIESFLMLAELESGYGARVFERRKSLIENVPGLVQDVIDMLHARAEQCGVSVKLAVEGTIPAVLGDRTYLMACIRQLIDNAIKFSPRDDRASVQVALREQDDQAVLSISDKGIGIPPAELDRLADTFYQIDRDKNEQQGAGAGLAIAWHVAALHGGRIEVESEVRKGSCFQLCLPGVDLREPA